MRQASPRTGSAGFFIIFINELCGTAKKKLATGSWVTNGGGKFDESRIRGVVFYEYFGSVWNSEYCDLEIDS